jgi:purine-binding chemotaxis protein CheW
MSSHQTDIGEDVSQGEFVTVIIGGQEFGIPVGRIHDVFVPRNITRVPLSRPEVEGVSNLRGRIVTVISMRRKLGLPELEDGNAPMAVGVEKGNESYGLIVDEVGEVLRLDLSDYERNPANLDQRWRDVARGIYRLEGRLLVVLDVDSVLAFAENDGLKAA